MAHEQGAADIVFRLRRGDPGHHGTRIFREVRPVDIEHLEENEREYAQAEGPIDCAGQWRDRSMDNTEEHGKFFNLG